ncbi:MAG: AMP-binding enzyme family protein [Blastococcus sp.]|nr:AMP-binding enzyme family protein [Blastococcus sp.]
MGADDIVQIQFTSGTTGFPKGTILRHRGVINNARFVAEDGGLPDGGVWVNAMPIFHLGSNVTAAMGTLSRGGTHILMRRFDAGVMLDLFESQRGNVSLVVPTMIIDLLDNPSLPGRHLGALTTLFSGATMVPVSLVERTRRALHCDFTILYGQTEASGNLTRTFRDDTPADQSETVGRPLPGVELAIADVDTGKVKAVGETGEIRARGYQVMEGYFDAPGQTAAALDAEGWLRTGDLGNLDERGYLRVVGRTKEVIIRGGMKVYPREIENLLFTHEAVRQASVVGVPDPRLGEVVAAIVIPEPDAPSSVVETLRAFCRENLAAYKTPVHWYVVDEYPVTPTNKVRKDVLQEWISAGRIRPTTTPGVPGR